MSEDLFKYAPPEAVKLRVADAKHPINDETWSRRLAWFAEGGWIWDEDTQEYTNPSWLCPLAEWTTIAEKDSDSTN